MPSEERTLLDYWLVVYMRRRVIALVVFSSMVSAGILSAFLVPVYQAKTSFFVSAKPDALAFFRGADSDDVKRVPLLPTPNKTQQEVYLGIVKGRDLMESVSHRVNKAFADLKKDTDFRLNSEYLIELYARDKDPSRAVLVAKTYPLMVNEFLTAMSAGPTAQKRVDLEKEIANLEQRLAHAETSLRDFQIRNQTVAIGEDVLRLAKERIDLEIEVERARSTVTELEKKAVTLGAVLKDEARAYVSSPQISSDPVVNKLRLQLTEIETKIASQRVDLRESHPEILKLKAQHSETREELEREIGRVAESELKDLNSYHESVRRQLVATIVERQVLQAKIGGLLTVIERIEKRITSFPDLRLKMDNLSITVAYYRDTLRSLRLQLDESRAQERRAMQNVIVVSSPTMPEQPVYPKTGLNVLVAGLLGLLAGVCYCFFIDYVERVRDPSRPWR